MRFLLRFLVCTALLSGHSLPTSTATERPLVEQIMEEVAANQDRAQELRRQFVYRQDVMVRLRGNKKLVREELRELQVTPTPAETEKTLVRLQGMYEKDGKMVEYDQLGFRPKSLDLDGELIDSFAEDFTGRQEIARRNRATLLPIDQSKTKQLSLPSEGRRTVSRQAGLPNCL